MKTFTVVPPDHLKRWNRRLRKKLRVGEFQQLGFTVSVVFAQPMNDAAYDHWLDEAIERIESLQLVVGGLGGHLPIRETDGFVTQAGSASVSPERRDALLAWLRAHPHVASADATDLVDAWHGEEDA